MVYTASHVHPAEPLRGPSTAPSSAESAEQHVAWLIARRERHQGQPYQYLLVLRFALINLVGIMLLGAAYAQGLVDKVVIADQTYLSVVIFFVFICGTAICGQKIWFTSRELNQIRAFDPLLPSRVAEYLAGLRGAHGETRGILASSLRLKLTQRITVVRHIAGTLVLLGLIGTVVGFIIALSGVQPEQASDVKAITPMVSTLIAGMSTALYTTLVGSVLNVWLMVNFQVLAGGTVRLLTALLEFGEDHARA